MAKIKVTIKPSQHGPVVSLRPLAFIEGPRCVGYCVGCRGLCYGGSAKCDVRVFSEAQQIRRGKRVG